MLYSKKRNFMKLENRFQWVLEDKKHGPDPCFDIDLWDNDTAAVIPTKGSMVPNWLLVVPRKEALSVLDLDPVDRKLILNLAAEVMRSVSSQGSFTFMFEHGPARKKSLVGCGVDQAHLHVVSLNFDLLSNILRSSEDDEMEWGEVEFSDPWKSLVSEKDYYMISDGERIYAAYAKPCSQYFRRKIANALGKPDEWDYKTHPNHLNAQETVGQFVKEFRIGKAA
jgi:diadenosine tetraphosphate (Ap4A) HIT family hydrolase